MKKQITILALILFSIFVNAQFVNITEEQGLINNSTTCFKKSDNGDLWIGTENGLSKKSISGAYTGYNTSNGLTHNLITDIEIDNYNKIWVGTSNGISIFDGVTWISQTFGSSSSNMINDIEIKQNGDIWIATNYGIKIYNGFTYYGYYTGNGLPTNEIKKIKEDSYGNMWIATQDGLCVFDGVSFTTYTTTDGLSNNYIKDLLIINDTVYFGAGTELNIYDGNNFIICDNIIQNAYGLNNIQKGDNNNIFISTFFNQLPMLLKINNLEIIDTYTYQNCNISSATNEIRNIYFSDSTLFLSINNKGYYYCKNFESKYFNDTLDINNIGALVNPWGILFENNPFYLQYETNAGYFQAPNEAGVNSNKLASIWIGGMSETNEFHMAGGIDYQSESSDWEIGPVSNNYLSEEYHRKYDRVWKIEKSEIDEHIANWSTTGYIMPESINNWPDIAEYEDINSNGIYDPENGDYPSIRGDQAILTVFNDDLGNYTQGRNKMKVEVHSLTYGYNSPDSALNNTIFTNYKIINKSNNNYHSVYLGIYDDADIGEPNDYFGTDTARNSYYFYNHNNSDYYFGTNNIPAQSVTFLNTQLKSTCYFSGLYDITMPIMEMLQPETPIEYYNYLMGYWRDGTPITLGGNGYGGTTQTNYVFTGDPSIPSGWNENDAGNTEGDRMGLGVVGPFDLSAGQELCIDVAYVNAIAWNFTNLHSVKKLKGRIEVIQNWYSNQSFSCDSIITYPQNALGIAAIDTSFCEGYSQPIQLQSIRIAGQFPFTYEWERETGYYNSTSEAPYVSCPSETTDYYVTITDNIGNTATDTLTIYVLPIPTIELGNDTSICIGNNIQKVLPSNYNYIWNTGSISNEINIHSTGNYVVTVSDNTCTSYDHIYIEVITPEINFTEITPACINETLQLSVNNYPSISWSTGETLNTININTSSLGQAYYYVTVTDTNSCSNNDSTLVVVNDLPNIYLGNDTTIDETWSLILDAYVGPSGNYIWSDGSSNSTYNFDGSIGEGTYNISVNVTDINGCSNSDDVNVSVLIGLFVVENGDFSVNVYPNPATYLLNVKLPDNKHYKYKIIDIKGKVIDNGVFYNTLNKINIKSVNAGTYFLIIDELNINKKIIINN